MDSLHALYLERAAIELEVETCNGMLKTFPRGPNGLMNREDLQRDYMIAKRAYNNAFAALRSINCKISKVRKEA